jgi:hydrogenase expression/formation protein HypC
MCLGVPGKVTDVFEEDGIRMGTVDFGGITRSACLEYAPEVELGSYVVIHVGFAISVVDEEEAARSYELLAEMGNLEDIDLPQTAEGVRAEDYRPGQPRSGPRPEAGGHGGAAAR